MIHTYVKTEPTTVTLKPSQVYTGYRAKIAIEDIMLAHDIVSFRPPAQGESFISAPEGDTVLRAVQQYGNDTARFIVKPRVNNIDLIWE